MNDQPKLAIYGFTTLFGPLDRGGVQGVDQEWLLKGHMVGPTADLSAGEMRLLTGCKLEQLTHTFSGISDETFTGLLQLVGAQDLSGGPGSWLTSYGSGDVVPASWWASWARLTGYIDFSSRGDLMALINGSFVAAARGLQAVDKIRQVLLDAVSLLGVVASPVGGSADASPMREVFADRAHNLPLSSDFQAPPQLPVSMRDLTPLITTVESTWSGFVNSLDSRLSSPSGNPVFREGSNGIEPVSNASFLDYGLRESAVSMRALLLRVVDYLQRFLARVADVATAELSGRSAVPYIQPAKVARALVLSISAPLPALHVVESGGVEDMADGALQACSALISDVNVAQQILEMTRTTVFSFLEARGVVGAPEWVAETFEALDGACLSETV